VSKKIKEDRCIILSDDHRIAKGGHYWSRNRPRETYNDILIRDVAGSIIGEEYRYPRRSMYIPKFYLACLHRNTPSPVKMHFIVRLAIRVKKQKYDTLIEQTLQGMHTLIRRPYKTIKTNFSFTRCPNHRNARNTTRIWNR